MLEYIIIILIYAMSSVLSRLLVKKWLQINNLKLERIDTILCLCPYVNTSIIFAIFVLLLMNKRIKKKTIKQCKEKTS